MTLVNYHALGARDDVADTGVGFDHWASHSNRFPMVCLSILGLLGLLHDLAGISPISLQPTALIVDPLSDAIVYVMSL